MAERGVPPEIYGMADARETVSMRFNGQRRKAAASATGHWSVRLDPMEAAEGLPLEITTPRRTAAPSMSATPGRPSRGRTSSTGTISRLRPSGPRSAPEFPRSNRSDRTARSLGQGIRGIRPGGNCGKPSKRSGGPGNDPGLRFLRKTGGAGFRQRVNSCTPPPTEAIVSPSKRTSPVVPTGRVTFSKTLPPLRCHSERISPRTER